MTAEVGYDNVHTTNVGNGKSLQGNLPNVGDAGGPSTAARNARKVPGSSIDIGVSLPHNSTNNLPPARSSSSMLEDERTNDFPNILMSTSHETSNHIESAKHASDRTKG